MWMYPIYNIPEPPPPKLKPCYHVFAQLNYNFNKVEFCLILTLPPPTHANPTNQE